jgi:hypothetical protein
VVLWSLASLIAAGITVSYLIMENKSTQNQYRTVE